MMDPRTFGPMLILSSIDYRILVGACYLPTASMQIAIMMHLLELLQHFSGFTVLQSESG